jgi:hypothetical protein
MTVLIETSFTGNTYPLNHGRVCWQRLSGTITATTEAAGFAAANAGTVRTDSYWQPTALPANWVLTFAAATDVSFIGIARHDLGTQNATVNLQYFDGTDWVNFPGLFNIMPDDDAPILALMSTREVEAVRVRILAADGNPTIGVISVGLADEWPRPFTWVGQPITEGDQKQFENTVSVGGNWLGRSATDRGLQFELTMQHASEAWRKTDFQAFKAWANGEGAAFFIAARPDDYPNELAYAMCGDVVTASREIPNKAVSTAVTLRCMGVKDLNG